MTADVDTLLDELARRHARGEPLEVDKLLVEAGPEADRLAELIDRFLECAPRGEPSDEALSFVRGLDEPPILRARIAKALRVDDVVTAISSACELRAEQREKLKRYYQQLEGGVLDPGGVAKPVWDVLADLLGERFDPSALPSGAPAAGAAYYRGAPATPATPDIPATPQPEPDEVDRLFGVTPAG